ncbi:MAG: hypothetical protein J3K34DRAFT_523859 [Monoraphidium minutum]|nr:MAG: hypothetical protein J3K34DRAFT_523859 [Monoraphidium minutum]
MAPQRARGSLSTVILLIACIYTARAARVDLGGSLAGMIVDGVPPAVGAMDRAPGHMAVAHSGDPPPFTWGAFLARKSSRLFGAGGGLPVEPHGSCRLHVYHPPPPSMTATLLCNGRDDAECQEPCIEGYTRRSKGLCHQHCPALAAAGAAVSPDPSSRCPGVMVCVRPGLNCPARTEDVPYWCPSPEALLESCAKHEYVAPLATRPKDAPCRGTVYRDFLGRWQCGDADWREPCRTGYNQSRPDGTCTQACPPWLLDCGGFCSSPKAGCAEPPRDLCPLGKASGCGIGDRTESLLSTACAAEGYRTTGSCPLTLKLHGGCGGSRLMLASGLRAQGPVVKIEAWWEGGKRSPPAAAGQAQRWLLAEAGEQQQHRMAEGKEQQQQQAQQQDGGQQQQDGGGQERQAPGAGGGEDARRRQQEQEAERRRQLEEPALVNFLPHAQMPSFREPQDTVLTAVRLTFARGLTQVLGNDTATYISSPRASYAFADGEALRRLTVWSTERSLDGGALTPLVGGFSFTTSRKGAFAAGEPPKGLPLVPLARPAAAAVYTTAGATPGGGGSGGGAGSGAGSGGWATVLTEGTPGPSLDFALIGGSNATLSGGALGSGLLVGAAAYTSGSALNALGFLFLRAAGPEHTELQAWNGQQQQQLRGFASLPRGLVPSRKPAVKKPARHQWHYCASDYDPMLPHPRDPLPPYAPPRAHAKDYRAAFRTQLPKHGRNRRARRRRGRGARGQSKLQDQAWKEAFQRSRAEQERWEASVRRRAEALARAEAWAAWKEARSGDFAQHYVKGKVIGSGSFGVVHLGIDLHTGQEVAVKVMPKQRGKLSKERTLQKLVKEVGILHQLQDCPNAVRLMGCFESDEEVQLVTELCTGGDLQKLSDDWGQMPERAVALIAYEVLKVVAACHAINVLHGDIKPANFVLRHRQKNPLVSGDLQYLFTPWLAAIDLGCSQYLGPERFSKRTGTPVYMAPEIFERDYYVEADMWSVGIMLYQLYARRFPYWSTYEQCRSARLEEVAALAQDAPLPLDYGPWLAMSREGLSFLRGCLTRDYSQRLTVEEALDHPWFDKWLPDEDDILAAASSSSAATSVDGTGGALRAGPLDSLGSSADEATSQHRQHMAGQQQQQQQQQQVVVVDASLGKQQQQQLLEQQQQQQHKRKQGAPAVAAAPAPAEQPGAEQQQQQQRHTGAAGGGEAGDGAVAVGASPEGAAAAKAAKRQKGASSPFHVV